MAAARARSRLLALLAGCVALGCGPAARDIAPSDYPSAGLYTPGSTLGASDPTDTPMVGVGLGNRCVVPGHPADAGAGPPSTAGTLQVDYTTQTQHGRYAPKNCTATWVETAAGDYVATLEIGAALRRPGLVYWQDHACTDKPGPDVVTSATLPDHTKPHKAMWSGVDFAGNPMPDGAYELFIEVTESDKEPGDFAAFELQKGPMAFSVDEPVAFDGPLQQVTVAWSPAPAGGTSGAAGSH
jgi:hypothetical protein